MRGNVSEKHIKRLVRYKLVKFREEEFPSLAPSTVIESKSMCGYIQRFPIRGVCFKVTIINGLKCPRETISKLSLS